MNPTRTLIAAIVFAATASLIGCGEKEPQDVEAEFGGPDREKRIKAWQKNMTPEQKAKQNQKSKVDQK